MIDGLMLDMNNSTGVEPMNYFGIDRNICAQLSFRASSVLPKVFYQGEEGSRRQKSLSNDRPKHPIPKNRHGLLGSEIALLALLGVAGLGLGYQALRKGIDARGVGKSVTWAVMWVGLTAVGAYGLVMALLGSIN